MIAIPPLATGGHDVAAASDLRRELAGGIGSVQRDETQLQGLLSLVLFVNVARCLG